MKILTLIAGLFLILGDVIRPPLKKVGIITWKPVGVILVLIITASFLLWISYTLYAIIFVVLLITFGILGAAAFLDWNNNYKQLLLVAFITVISMLLYTKFILLQNTNVESTFYKTVKIYDNHKIAFKVNYDTISIKDIKTYDKYDESNKHKYMDLKIYIKTKNFTNGFEWIAPCKRYIREEKDGSK